MTQGATIAVRMVDDEASLYIFSKSTGYSFEFNTILYTGIRINTNHQTEMFCLIARFFSTENW
jgi:hypothetical protein